MKTKLYVLILGTLLLVASTSCDLDNFDEPEVILSGNVVYNGEAVPVARNQVRFQLWQSGYGIPAPIDVAVTQDGSYSSRLFPGDYKLIFLPSEGPFKAPTDTIYFNLNGSMTKDIQVTPYYIIRNPQFSHSGGNITATCSLEQIISGTDARNIERVTLVINRTLFVDVNSGSEGSLAQIDAADISDLSNLSMSVAIPEDTKKPDQNYYFARIGVKISGVEDMIYTQVEKINL